MEKRKYTEELTFAAARYGKERDYWLKKLSGDLVKSCFPCDHKKSNEKDYKTDFIKIDFPADYISRLLELSKGLDHRIHMILTAGVMVLLLKYTGHEDIMVGIPIYKQEIEGEFLNTALVIRSSLHNNMTFKELLLHEVRQAIIEANENQNYPMETLLYQLGYSFSGTEFPLFDIVILLENIHEKKYIEHTYPGIIFSFIRKGEYLEGVLEYNTRRYHRRTVERIVTHFKMLLSQVIFNIDIKLSVIEILSQEGKNRLLFEFNNVKTEYPGKKTIDLLFEEQVERVPDRAGLICGENLLSYGELNSRSGEIARYLRVKGVKLEEAVGIMVKRSKEMFIGILGILKAGGAYLPIDREYPEKRKSYLLHDGNVRLLLTNYEDEVNDVSEVINLDHFVYDKIESKLERLHRWSNLAYIMYTSGSTGNPKGIMVEHRNVVRLVKNTNFIELREGDRILQTGPLEFDASTFEIWWPLLNGLQLCEVDRDVVLIQEELKAAVRKNKINTMWMTSALFNQVLDIDIEIFSGLRNLLVGGDVLSPIHINRVRSRFPGLNVINGYGPTENTTFSTAFRIDQEYSDSIPIGKPIANSTAYIVDKYNNLVPLGAVGELCVGGDGVSRGYMNNPGLTGEKYIIETGPFVTGERIYKTGDLARWLLDGNLDFIGRSDYQVKIRGYRIEPKEIENYLTRIDFVTEAVVLEEKNDSGEKYLIAYFTADKEVAAAKLKSVLARDLPDYMIPLYFVRLEKLPLTPNGKLDQKVLPGPEMQAEDEIVPPGNDIERKLVNIWSEVLSIDLQAISIYSDFFELGGHSLKATYLISKIQKEFKVKVPLTVVFEKPTIRELSEYIKNENKTVFNSIKNVEKKEYYKLSSAQKRLYFIQIADVNNTHYNCMLTFPIYKELTRQKIRDIINKLIKRHESLRTSFQMVNSVPVQKIHDDINFEVEYYKDAGDKNKISKILKKFVRPFNLSQALLLRIGIAKTMQDYNLLIIDIHHILTDGTSLNIIERDFSLFMENQELPVLRIQYKDYSEWQNNEQQKRSIEHQKEYWLKKFSGSLPVLNLPTDYQKTTVFNFEGGYVCFEIGKEQTGSLYELANSIDVTLYMILLACFYVLLSKLCDQEDIIIGTAFSGRSHPDLGNITGILVNTLALRSSPGGGKQFLEFLKELKNNILEAFENEDYQFDDLVDELMINRERNKNPIFNVVFGLQNFMPSMGQDLELKKSEFPLIFENKTSKFDLTLIAFEVGNYLSFIFEYDSKLFKEETIKRFIHYFKNIIAVIIKDNKVKIKDIKIGYDLVDPERIIPKIDFNLQNDRS